MTKNQALVITLLATVLLAGSGFIYVRGAPRRALKSQLEVAEKDLAQLRTRYGEENRRVKEQLLEISNLEQQLVGKK